jgi:hypothetical protein
MSSSGGKQKKGKTARKTRKEEDEEPRPNTRLASFWRNTLFSDIIVECENTDYPCHRVALSYVPYLFTNMTAPSDGTGNSGVIKISEKASENRRGITLSKMVLKIKATSWDILHRWIYQMPLNLEKRSVESLFEAADDLMRMKADELNQELWKVIETHIDPSDPNNGYFERYLELSAKHSLPLTKITTNATWKVMKSLTADAITYIAARATPTVGLYWSLGWCVSKSEEVPSEDRATLLDSIDKQAELPNKSCLAALFKHHSCEVSYRYVMNRMLGLDIPLKVEPESDDETNPYKNETPKVSVEKKKDELHPLSPAATNHVTEDSKKEDGKKEKEEEKEEKDEEPTPSKDTKVENPTDDDNDTNEKLLDS